MLSTGGGDRDLHMHVRPAALKAGAAISARVVGLSSQYVLTGRAESGGRCGFSFTIKRRSGIFEAHRAWAAKLTPKYARRWTSTRARFRRLFAVIGDP